MIEINLNKQAEGVFRPNYMALLRKAVLIILANGMLYSVTKNHEKEVLQDLEKKMQEQEWIKSQSSRKLESVQKITQDIQTLVKQQETLEGELQKIQSLHHPSKAPNEALFTLAKVVPKDVWITKVEWNPREFSILGGALNFDQVGQFLKALHASKAFETANLKSSTSQPLNLSTHTIEFEIFGTSNL